MKSTKIRMLLAAAAVGLACGSASAQVDILKKVKESGAITLGVRDASGAMSFTLGAGKYTGFHVEVCQRIVSDMQKLLQMDKLTINYQLVTPQNRIPLLQNGTVDMVCGTATNNAARQKDVAFAPSLFIEGVRLAVRTGSPITSMQQLAGKSIGATTGTTSVQVLRKIRREAPKNDFSEVLAKDNSEGFLLLESSRVDGFVADGQILATLISRSRDPSQFKILEQVLTVEPIAVMIPKGDPAFKTLVDESVVALAKSGDAAQLYDKWFMQPIPPGNVAVGLPANALTKAAWANPSDKPLEAYDVK